MSEWGDVLLPKVVLEQHCFEDQQLGEDTTFLNAAIQERTAAWLNAEKFIVIRAHANNSCASARAMGGLSMPEIGWPIFLPVSFGTCYEDSHRCDLLLRTRSTGRTFTHVVDKDRPAEVDCFFFYGRGPYIMRLSDEIVLDCG